jgi:hypothetical protein
MLCRTTAYRSNAKPVFPATNVRSGVVGAMAVATGELPTSCAEDRPAPHAAAGKAAALPFSNERRVNVGRSSPVIEILLALARIPRPDRVKRASHKWSG